MTLHQRQNPTDGSTFTFSNAGPNPSTESEYDKWAEKIKARPGYFAKPEDAKFGPWTRRAPDRGEEDGSSTPSPELWKTQVRSAGSSPVHVHGAGARARAQVISQYRKEMLDLVRGMPETAYELSLRDIVESPKVTTPLQATEEEGEAKRSDEKKKKRRRRRNKKDKTAGAATISRSQSADIGGLTLRMFVPRIPGFLKGRKSAGSSENFSKVSPKPAPGDAEKNGPEKSVDREWWSVEFEPMSSSSGSSCSSNGNGGGGGKRSINRKLTGCYSFFQSR